MWGGVDPTPATTPPPSFSWKCYTDDRDFKISIYTFMQIRAKDQAFDCKKKQH